MKTEIYQVNGMHCMKCVSKIENKINNMDGVKKASVELKKSQLTVEYTEDKINKEVLKEVIDDLGYELV